MGCKYLEFNDEQLDNFIKLLILMYADDTIILADSEHNMQTAFNGQSKEIVTKAFL